MLSDIRRLEVPGKHGQRGQTLLIFGLMFVFLMGIVGLATDSAFAYFRSISIERAAAAAALAGVPYMPNTYASGAPGRQDAYDRAIDEAARNGFVSGAGVTVTPAKTPGERELAVTITAPSQTFFMNALGFSKFNVVRTAVAGYKPPIALGQPGNQAGSTVSELGSGASFFFARYKGWNLQRSEGDAFTPNPDEAATGAGFRSKDVHQFSQVNGVESSALDCTSSSPFKMPCRGGYNWRIVVPAGQSAEVQVYNATYGPDLGTVRGNRCDNQQGLPTAYCNISGYHYHEDDIGTGSHCNPTCNAAQQQTYNATAYTLLDVPNVFLRSQDKVLTQTTVYPIDATNYDGAQGNTGINSPAQPSYINVKDNVTVNQYYDGTGAPCNMKIYHAWMDVANYSGNRVGSCPSGDNIVSGGSPKNLVERVAGAAVAGACGTPCVYNSPKQLSSSGSALGPGTYRLRVDALNFDGSFSTIGGNSSKGYAVRVVDAADKTAASCVGCSVSGWQDMCVYTPIVRGTGVVPLFELTSDYAGSTIDVDVFDIGDSGGQVKLGIIDPTTGALAALGSTGYISNNGISRLGPVVAHTPPQSPTPLSTGFITPSTSGSAEYQAASTSYGPEYQGSWIRISIPIPAGYSPPAYPNDFWSLQYINTGGANDTFSFTVSARGGPVHLLRS